jgi:hypothetical protein
MSVPTTCSIAAFQDFTTYCQSVSKRSIELFCMLQDISADGLINCSYRKTEVRECQPDVSYYVSDSLQDASRSTQLAPRGNSIVDLDEFPAPDLAIEVVNNSLNDDLGQKRLLY